METDRLRSSTPVLSGSGYASHRVGSAVPKQEWWDDVPLHDVAATKHMHRVASPSVGDGSRESREHAAKYAAHFSEAQRAIADLHRLGVG